MDEATITPYRDGPLLVPGPFRLADQDGNPIDAGRRTIALCRCGKSRTRPFCDGTHKGPAPARQARVSAVQTTLKASYTNHYRRGLIGLLGVLEFRSSSAHQPIIEALELIGRLAGAGNITYYPLGEVIPMHRGLRGDREDVLYREDARGRRRVVRMVYEVATFQALRDALRCKEGSSGPTAGAGPTKTSQPTTRSAASSTTGRYASRLTRPSSSTSCASRSAAS